MQIRLPDIICIEKRLPKGAAAVLVNQTHTYTVLFLPIDSKEKLLYNGIDGICNINDIAEKELRSLEKNSRTDIARTFFEKLWWYDQVVFDAAC